MVAVGVSNGEVMKRKVVFFAAIVVVLGLGSSAHAEAVCDEQLVVFGDSLSDTGNVLIASYGASRLLRRIPADASRTASVYRPV